MKCKHVVCSLFYVSLSKMSSGFFFWEKHFNLKICVPNVLPWFVVWHATELQQAQSLAEDLSKHFFLLSRQDGDFRVKLFIVQHVHSSCYTFSVYLRLRKKDRSLLQDLCCLLKSLTEVN